MADLPIINFIKKLVALPVVIFDVSVAKTTLLDKYFFNFIVFSHWAFACSEIPIWKYRDFRFLFAFSQTRKVFNHKCHVIYFSQVNLIFLNGRIHTHTQISRAYFLRKWKMVSLKMLKYQEKWPTLSDKSSFKKFIIITTNSTLICKKLEPSSSTYLFWI